MKNKLLKIICVIIVSISVAALIVIGAKLLGYQCGGGGDNDMIPWWNMLQSLFGMQKSVLSKYTTIL